MPFDPELQARIDAARSKLEPGATDPLRRKLAAREGKPGYAANVAEIKHELETRGGDEGE